jgi:hypothetical protein
VNQSVHESIFDDRAGVSVNRRTRAWLFLKTPFEGIPPLALVLGALGTAFAFLFFNQSDLYHTVLSSYAYLHGHVYDFYDYNKLAVGGNDYLPGIYGILAVWMLPFKLFRGLSDPFATGLALSPAELLWAKLLLVLVFLACFYVLSAIAKHAFSDNESAQRTVRAAYLFSPLVGFAVFTFGQYDIFSTLFTLLGVLMYFRRRPFWFVFWFSIAISFKYFAFFLFIPLAIYYFKRPLRILLAFVGGAAATVILLASYWHSAIFRVSAFRLAEGKAGDSLHNQILILMGILFLALCVLAFLYGRRRDDLTKPLVLIWAAGYAIMFLAVVWHPQWTLILAPAFALSLGLMKRPGWFLLWESLAFAAFVVVFTNRWVMNVDAIMITRGVLSPLLNDPTLLQHDIVGPSVEPFAAIVVTVFFMSPLLWLAGERAAGLHDGDAPARAPRRWVWSVRALTVPLTLTLPSLVFTFIPWETAMAITPEAVANGTRQVTTSTAQPDAVADTTSDVLVQDFDVEGDGLTGVSIPTAGYLRENQGSIEVTVENQAGDRVGETTVESSALAGDKWVYVTFAPIADSSGQTYTVRIAEEARSQEDVVGFWLVPHETGSDYDTVVKNGVATDSSLLFTYYLR